VGIAMRILLFDGECNLCNGAVQFLIKKDRHELFKFASLQSPIGGSLVGKYNVAKELDSFVYIKDGKAFTKSDAALHVSRDLGGIWKLAFLFICIPRSIRDKVYDFIAKNRYKWFGKKDVCMLPTPELKKRFLNDKEEL
jgi:predicted DCC family thiol-disulfide oxidoreductase YuxK